MVRGDTDEHFLDYGYLKQNSKFLHSFRKKCMPNSFSGTFFNRHWIQYESGALDTRSSEIFHFLLSITDRVEDINRHKGSVNLYPIDVPYNSSEVEDAVKFNQSKLDYEDPDKQKMTEAVARMLSNANLVKNADGLLSKRSSDSDIECIGPNKKRLPENGYKMSY